MQRDKTLIARRFSASFERYDRLAETQRRICRRLAEMLASAMAAEGARTPERIAEIGAGTGFLTEQLAQRFPQAHFLVNDLCPEAQPFLEPILKPVSHKFCWGDAEKIDLPRGLDLIASASTIQWLDDPRAFLRKCSWATRVGGWLALASFGMDNFREIREFTGRGLDYPDLTQITDYQIVAREEYHETIDFPTPLELLRHIRDIGVNALSGAPLSAKKLHDFKSKTLTYHPILIVARRKD